MAAKKYQMLRLTVETWEMLQELKTAMEISNLEGKTCYDSHEQFGISLDTVVKELVRRDIRWKERKRESAARKRAGARFDQEGGLRPARLHNADSEKALYTVTDQEEPQGEQEEE